MRFTFKPHWRTGHPTAMDPDIRAVPTGPGKESRRINAFQRALRFITNSLKERHPGFFASVTYIKGRSLNHAKKTGIQI